MFFMRTGGHTRVYSHICGKTDNLPIMQLFLSRNKFFLFVISAFFTAVLFNIDDS